RRVGTRIHYVRRPVSPIAKVSPVLGPRALAQLPPLATLAYRNRQAVPVGAGSRLAPVRAPGCGAMTEQSDFVRQQSEWAKEDAPGEREQSRPNGIDREPRQSMPAIDQADVVRWKGQEPPEIVFTFADLVPQGMVTLLTGQGGA